MAAISTWSSTAASNNSNPPDGFPEGMAPSAVNDAAREVMAAIRTWYEDAQWINLGYTHSYVSATSFKIAGTDYTSTYHVGRRVRVVATTPGTIYGTIVKSAFSTDTTLTIEFDSGSLSNEALTVSIGALTADNPALPRAVEPIGEVVDYAGTSAPDGWLLCYGQALDANTSPQYQALFDVIGNTYGGSDNTDFVVPDLRGRVVAGYDAMGGGGSADRLTDQSGGVNGDVLGDSGGSETHTLAATELAAHIHQENGFSTSGSALADTTLAGSTASFVNSVGTSAHSTEVQTGGGGGAHNNVQPTFILNKIIRYR